MGWDLGSIPTKWGCGFLGQAYLVGPLYQDIENKKKVDRKKEQQLWSFKFRCNFRCSFSKSCLLFVSSQSALFSLLLLSSFFNTSAIVLPSNKKNKPLIPTMPLKKRGKILGFASVHVSFFFKNRNCIYIWWHLKTLKKII